MPALSAAFFQDEAADAAPKRIAKAKPPNR